MGLQTYKDRLIFLVEKDWKAEVLWWMSLDGYTLFLFAPCSSRLHSTELKQKSWPKHWWCNPVWKVELASVNEGGAFRDFGGRYMFIEFLILHHSHCLHSLLRPTCPFKELERKMFNYTKSQKHTSSVFYSLGSQLIPLRAEVSTGMCSSRTQQWQQIWLIRLLSIYL